MGVVLERYGLPEPFPRAFAYDFSMSPEELEDVLTAGGFTDVAVETEVIDVSWPTLDDAVYGIAGSPYGPAVSLFRWVAESQRLIATSDKGFHEQSKLLFVNIRS